jgi:RHS repeat-associated protein
LIIDSNHLGNVLAVVTDNIHMADDRTTATVASASDYYPFGLQMDGRTFSSADYRYGFNGKEKDESFVAESADAADMPATAPVGGPDPGDGGDRADPDALTATHYDYGFRIYNPSRAKFLSVDPLTKSYPMLTPYQFASNTPIQAIDLDGLESYHYVLNLDKEDPKPVLVSGEDIVDEVITGSISLFGFQIPVTRKTVINERQEYYVTATYSDYDATDVLAIPVTRQIEKRFYSKEFAENATGSDFENEIESEVNWRQFWQGFATDVYGGRPSTSKSKTRKQWKSAPRSASEGSQSIVGTKHSGFKPTQDYINPQKVAEYKKLIKDKVKIDPIEVYRQNGNTYIEEGHHRYVAYKELGIEPDVIKLPGGGPVGLPDWSGVEFQTPTPDLD